MITFNPENHTYEDDGIPIPISVTQLLEKHGLAPDYSAVPADVLKRKAQIGTQIHAEIENYINTGEIPDFGSDEFYAFVELIKAADITFTSTEEKVSREMVAGEKLAGRIDLLGDNIIADVKTSQTLDREYVRWQLSLYAWLKYGDDIAVEKPELRAIHLPIGGKAKIVALEMQPLDEIHRLIDAERNGEIYAPPVVALDNNSLGLLYDVETLLVELNAEVKKAEERKATILSELLAAMEAANVTKYESDTLAITYVAPSTRETVDTAKLKKEYPEAAAACKKTSETKAYVKVKVK